MNRLVSLDDLLDATAVAAAVGLTHRNSVTTYMHRYSDFPRPLLETSSGRCRLWSRADIDQWIATRQETTDSQSR